MDFSHLKPIQTQVYLTSIARRIRQCIKRKFQISLNNVKN